MIVFYEPDSITGKANRIEVTEKEAIKQAKAGAFKANGYIYNNDQEALNDFITIHWAFQI